MVLKAAPGKCVCVCACVCVWLHHCYHVSRLSLYENDVNSGGSQIGYVQVFHCTRNPWEQCGSTIASGTVGALFGSSVALSSDGNTVALTAPWHDGTGTSHQVGLGQVYWWDQGEWRQLGADIYGTTDNDRLEAKCLSADGMVLVVGARQQLGTARGYVRVYQYIDGEWVPHEDDIIGEQNGDQLGFSVCRFVAMAKR